MNWSRINSTILHGERDRCPAQEKTGTNTSGVKEAPRFLWRFLFYAQDTTPYGQKTHPALRYQKKFKYFNGDEFIEGTDYWMAE